ncbi:MAG: hypothetical protein HXY20_06475 [Acidobacteria bacterium]|nr:hypothetical protein [Acidobacteriota bacterium]
MTRKWIFINVALALVSALLAWHLRVSIREFDAANDIARIQPIRDIKKPASEEVLPPLKPARRYDPAEFQIIPAQNLFAESRSREDKTDTSQVQEAPPLTVKPVLVGVTLVGSQRLALIVDPSVSGPGRKTQTKRPGDSYQGYIITDIGENRMVLENGARREVIPLYDGSKRPTQGGKTPILATRVISFGAGPAQAGAVPVRSVPTALVQPRPAAQAQPSVAPVGQAASAAAPEAGIARTTLQGRQVPGAPPSTASPGERTDEQGRRIIRTPFGDIVRPNPQ